MLPPSDHLRRSDNCAVNSLCFLSPPPAYSTLEPFPREDILPPDYSEVVGAQQTLEPCPAYSASLPLAFPDQTDPLDELPSESGTNEEPSTHLEIESIVLSQINQQASSSRQGIHSPDSDCVYRSYLEQQQLSEYQHKSMRYCFVSLLFCAIPFAVLSFIIVSSAVKLAARNKIKQSLLLYKLSIVVSIIGIGVGLLAFIKFKVHLFNSQIPFGQNQSELCDEISISDCTRNGFYYEGSCKRCCKELPECELDGSFRNSYGCQECCPPHGPLSWFSCPKIFMNSKGCRECCHPHYLCRYQSSTTTKVGSSRNSNGCSEDFSVCVHGFYRNSAGCLECCKPLPACINGTFGT